MGVLILSNKKKDGGIQICIDYVELNKLTIKNKYPLPRIIDLLEQLREDVNFSKINLWSEYHEVQI